MKTSVIIAIHNHPVWTKKCLESMSQNTKFDDGDRELVIIDNGSRENTKSIIEKHTQDIKNKTIISNESNKGSYFAWNQGIDASSGDLVCICHNDVIFTKNWLEPIEGFLLGYKDDYNEIGFVSPSTLYTGELEYVADKEMMDRYARDLKFNNKKAIKEKEIDTILSILYPDGINHYASKVPKNRSENYEFSNNIATFCFIAKREIYDRFGKFDEQFYPHTYAEKILHFHANAEGYEAACCFDSYVFHNGNTTSDGGNNNYELIDETNKSLYEEKMRGYYEMQLEKPYEI